MYIPEFWCGVLATIICEVLTLVGALIWSGTKSKNSGGKK